MNSVLVRLMLLPAIFSLDAYPLLGRVTELQVAALTLVARPQPAIGDTPTVPSRPDSAIGEKVSLALLDGMGPVQAGVSRHSHQTARSQVDVYATVAVPELHEDGRAYRESI